MKILFIGGTGNISLACTERALAKGHIVYHLNRGMRTVRAPEGVISLYGDIRKTDEMKTLLGGLRFDVVADFISFEPEHVRSAVALFRDKTHQYIFISSASVYHKPPRHYIITEATPAFNPFWTYSQNKIACEVILTDTCQKSGFPMTIVRPSHTYSESYIPFPYGKPDFTVAQRILDGRAIILPGDGQSLWTLTHATDFAIGFVGLFGNPYAIGETFHITSDFVYTWDVIAGLVGETLGAAPRIVHLPSEFIASINPGIGDGLLGDKCYSMIFDNTKIKRAVPEYRATIPFHEGIRRCVAWFMEDKNRRIIDRDLDSALDEIIASWNE